MILTEVYLRAEKLDRVPLSQQSMVLPECWPPVPRVYNKTRMDVLAFLAFVQREESGLVFGNLRGLQPI